VFYAAMIKFRMMLAATFLKTIMFILIWLLIVFFFFLQILPSYKKQKLDGESASLPKLDLALKGLSRAQLITLLQKMASKHQEVKNVFSVSHLITRSRLNLLH